jgi:hypothetical protein
MCRILISIQTQPCLALVAPHHPSEHFVAAFRAVVAFFLILHPLPGTDFTPQGDTPQYDLFPHSHGELIDEPAGKFIAFMAS